MTGLSSAASALCLSWVTSGGGAKSCRRDGSGAVRASGREAVNGVGAQSRVSTRWVKAGRGRLAEYLGYEGEPAGGGVLSEQEERRGNLRSSSSERGRSE